MKYRIKQEGKLFYAQKKGRFSFSWEDLINWEFILKYNLSLPEFEKTSHTIFLSYESALRAIEKDKKSSVKEEVVIYNI
jgi:hypothetical protein